MTRRSRRSRWAQQRPAFGYNMTAADAAEFLGISSRCLAALRRSGLGPSHVTWRRKVWYALEDLVLFSKLHSERLTPPKIDRDG
jgi:hypothetical protein